MGYTAAGSKAPLHTAVSGSTNGLVKGALGGEQAEEHTKEWFLASAECFTSFTTCPKYTGASSQFHWLALILYGRLDAF
jgi:hypothetical protein